MDKFSKLLFTGCNTLLLLVSFIWFKAHQKQELLIETQSTIESYQAEMIPLYLQKSEVARQVLEKLKNTDSNVSGILLHMKNWKVNSTIDISEIEELNTHLDTWLSPYVSQLQTLAQKDKSLIPLMTEVRWLDQSLNSIRSRLLKSAPQINSAK